MMRNLIGLCLAALLALAPGLAAAQDTQVIVYRGSGAAAYVGPGDVVSGASGFYSCSRSYNAAWANGTNKLCNLRNTVTAEKCDILAATSGGPAATVANCTSTSNGLSVSAFCALSAGSCVVVTAYDQTGNTRDITQATGGNQPILKQNCPTTGFFCWELTTTTSKLAFGTNFTPATGVVTISSVTNRSVGTSSAGTIILQENGTSGNRLTSSTSANQVKLVAGSTLSATMSDATWHAVNSVVNGASSVINVDGVETSGTTGTGSVTASQIASGAGVGSTEVDVASASFWDNLAFTSGNRTAMCQNQQAFFGGSFGAVC